MAILRTDIVKAFNELILQEEGMRFQGLAVVIGKMHWPELIARPRKKDFGLDAYAPSSQTPEKIGKGLAASISSSSKKISADAETAKKNFPDLSTLLFVTCDTVGNTERKRLEEAIQKKHGIELHLIEREEIITLMMMPDNAKLCASFLYLNIDAEPLVTDLIDKTKRANSILLQNWAGKTKGQPLIALTAVELENNGAESFDVLPLEQIEQRLSHGRRILLEGSAGCGKTTTLVQIAQLERNAGIPLLIELPTWTSSRLPILHYIAGMPAFQAEGLTPADLARVQQAEPILFLLNGWNEIAESNSTQASQALRELERDFPSAGIIVATRTHHLIPPLPGAMRLRILPLRSEQRTAYLTARLGERSEHLRGQIEADLSLDELTRTPFILCEVASLLEAGIEIPSTKIEILNQVCQLQERRDEHRNTLQTLPIFGYQAEYLRALAVQMTSLGSVTLSEPDARPVVFAVAQRLMERGEIDQVRAPAIMATLTAHHLLVRIDYPNTAFQFVHQQIQEYYAALDVRSRLFNLRDDDPDMIARFTADYLNNPAWSEPLRMIAETFAMHTGNRDIDTQNSSAGVKLITIALQIDIVFAGELAQLCGNIIWNKVSKAVSKRLRAVYALQDTSFQNYALAAMFATGRDDFRDIILPLLSSEDRQVRIRTYFLRPVIKFYSLGSNWREQVRGWSEDARVDFVALMHHKRLDSQVAAFAAEDSVEVKKTAVINFISSGSDDALAQVLDSMDAKTFEDVARRNPQEMPKALIPKTIAAMLNFVGITSNNPERLQTLLHLIDFGQAGLEDMIKMSMRALSDAEVRNLSSHSLRLVVKQLRKTDPVWVSEWVIEQIIKGILYNHDYWLQIATPIPIILVERYLQILETKVLDYKQLDGIISVLVPCMEIHLATRVFSKLHELRCKIEPEPDILHEFESRMIRQLETMFERLPDHIAVASILNSVTSGHILDIRIATDLISKAGRPDAAPLHLVDENLRNIREFLKASIELVLSQDDFSGKEKANLISSIAQVGKSEDMLDLVKIIRADIERMRRGQAARAAGERGGLGNGGCMSYANWNIPAVTSLDPVGAESVLIDLLRESEYLSEVATAMARDYVPKQEKSFNNEFRHDLMWVARQGDPQPSKHDLRRTRYIAALNIEIKRLQNENQTGQSAHHLLELAKALAAIGGRESAKVVLDVLSAAERGDEYTRLDIIERLLVAGAALPCETAFTLIDSVLDRPEKWFQQADRDRLCRILTFCPFLNDPALGISKMRDVIKQQQIRGYELRGIITSLGQSRSDAAFDLLYEFAMDASTFDQCEDYLINAITALDTPRACRLLLGFVDPDNLDIELTRPLRREDVMVESLAALAQRNSAANTYLRQLCERDLPELNRHILSKVMNSLGGAEDLIANLNLIDDNKPKPIPSGLWEHLESIFLERRTFGQDKNTFTQHSRASNELRLQLFKMVAHDLKREKSAFALLGQIEQSRLKYGRPFGEPRHPDITSGQLWPPNEI